MQAAGLLTKQAGELKLQIIARVRVFHKKIFPNG
jgi:hypothetical protein